MTSRDFCLWLQGYFELGKDTDILTGAQIAIVRKHLNLVFKHEIDPSFPPHQQNDLNDIHNTGHLPSNHELIRC